LNKIRFNWLTSNGRLAMISYFFATEKQQPEVVPQASFPKKNQAQKWPEIPEK